MRSLSHSHSPSRSYSRSRYSYGASPCAGGNTAHWLWKKTEGLLEKIWVDFGYSCGPTYQRKARTVPLGSEVSLGATQPR